MSDLAGEAIEECINCCKPLRSGDKALSYTDGPVACEACAPTWEQSQRDWESTHRWGNPEGWKEFKIALALHLQAGGAMTDKHVHAL